MSSIVTGIGDKPLFLLMALGTACDGFDDAKTSSTINEIGLPETRIGELDVGEDLWLGPIGDSVASSTVLGGMSPSRARSTREAEVTGVGSPNPPI
jgi:hypothetical protein